MDFYWNYSGKDIIDNSGKANFSRAIMVAAQVFNSLTEYIQVLKNEIKLLLQWSPANIPPTDRFDLDPEL